MFIPKRLKFRKCHLDYIGRVAADSSPRSYQTFTIVNAKSCRISSNVLETLRKTASSTLERKGVIRIAVFPHTPRSKKSAGTRMGGGAGALDSYTISLAPGTPIILLDNITLEEAKKVLDAVRYKINAGLILHEKLCCYE